MKPKSTDTKIIFTAALAVIFTAFLILAPFVTRRIQPLFPERVGCPYDCPCCNGELSRDWGE